MENRFIRLLDFANNQLGEQNAYTLADLRLLQHIHEDWATRQYSINDILEKHGIAPQQWSGVIDRASKWYGGSTKESDIINKEIKAHIKGVIGYLPAQIIESQGMFSGQLSSLFRNSMNGRIQRFKGADNLFRYYIN